MCFLHEADAPTHSDVDTHGRARAFGGGLAALAKALYGALEAAVPEASPRCSGQPDESRLDDRQAPNEASRSLLDAVRCLDQAAEEATEDTEDMSSHGWRLLRGLLAADTPAMLLDVLESLGFEERKDAVRLFSALVRLALRLRAEATLVAYFRGHTSLIPQLLQGSGCTEVFAHCAEMLTSCSRSSQLVEELLRNGAANRLIDLAGSRNFEISSEAFSSLRELLTAHVDVSEPFVYEHFDEFCDRFHTLLCREQDYVVKRPALKLLGDVLMHPEFADVMLRYVANERFLRIHMNLLLDESKSIQLGAFHVFKVFVANPEKPARVRAILERNQQGLMRMMFQMQRGAGENLALEADLDAVRSMLAALSPQPRCARAATA